MYQVPAVSRSSLLNSQASETEDRDPDAAQTRLAHRPTAVTSMPA